ncbi:MAG: alpha/beta hydrolase [Bacteroidota bacterium]|nr:alpha/beta hydrolase [Bacteroidota bacterium]
MEKQFEFNNSLISYQVEGNGQPVILLHGFAEEGTIWQAQVQFLQQYCQLIIPDLPGSGKSPLLPQKAVTIEDYADCIHALLQLEKIDQCILLGHSMGGYIAIAFAEMYPEHLSAFGFIHSTAFADNEEKKNTRKKGIELINQYGVYPFLKNTTPNLFSKTFKEAYAGTVSELIEKGKEFSQEALVQYYTAMMTRPDRTDTLKRTNVPVLFVIGSEDVAAPLEDLLQQVHLPKTSYIHVMDNTGHMSMLEKPQELNKHLLQFIQDVFPFE